MKSGSQKGASFEREIAKELSRWMSDGARTDLFWRTAMSGGRATVINRAGGNIRSQLGDLTSIDEEGAPFTNIFVVEMKHQKSIYLDSYLVRGTGPIAKWWSKLQEEANTHSRLPMLIMRQNRFPTLVAVDARGRRYLREVAPMIDVPRCAGGMTLYAFADFLDKAKPDRFPKSHDNSDHGSV